VQKLLSNPQSFERFREFLTQEIEGLDRLTDQVMYQAMKKKPKRVEQVKEACVGT
jgi:hypothetical protein